nr:MAG TPA: hypothetical protein [Caudoviricetes sp.]
MEENLFDLLITRRKDKNILEIPEGKEQEYLVTDTMVISMDLADIILSIGQIKNEEEKMQRLKELFNKFYDANGNEYNYDLDDIYTFVFRRHK